MKKLMTSLLAVMLCGIGFLWADGATVKGTVQCVWEGTPSSAGLTGTVTLYQNNAVTSYSATLNGGAYEITGVPEGNYTAKFAGTMRGQSCAGDNTANVGSGAAMHGGEIECNIMAALSSSPGTDPTPSTVTMKVSVGYNVDEYNTGVITFKSIKGATVTCKQGETTIATATTASDWQNEGIASLNGITVGETYSISVHADGFKDTTLNNVTGVATATNREALKIGMREALVTVSGTLKLGETALTELPEGMTLMIGANGTGNTAQINESGYTVECKPGNMKVGIVDQIGDDYSPDFQKSLTANYTVTTPENASFTVPDNAETFTQDIVLTKAYAAVIGVDASDKLNDNELTLTKQGETEAAYTAKFLYGTNKFRFNGVEAGTYTLGLNKFGYKLKGEAPTVTVAADLADVTLSAPVEIEEIEEATATWTGTVRYNAADGYTPVYVEGATVTLYAR
ncbi:MAG: hypothetical protein K2L03_05275, partial [Bacteroidales bacterium]|nr:hypothetical protein [Bacteroidales bacterium]